VGAPTVTCCNATVPTFVAKVALSILLPGCTRYEVLKVTGTFVGDIKQAVVSTFYQLKGLKIDQLRLLKVGDDGVSLTPLESTQQMAEAGLLAGDMAKIVVEYTAVPMTGVSGMCMGG